MDNIEALLLLFSDSLMEALVLPPYAAYIWKVMVLFGTYSLSTVWGLAALGATSGMVLNWGLGKVLLTCRQRDIIIVESSLLDKCSVLFPKYAAWLLLFSWVPVVGTVLVIAAGLLSTRFFPMLLFVAIGNAVFFAYQIFLF